MDSEDGEFFVKVSPRPDPTRYIFISLPPSLPSPSHLLIRVLPQQQLASFVRSHEKALANALQSKRQNAPRHGHSQSTSSVTVQPSTALPERPSTSASSATSALASAFSLGAFKFTSNNVKSAKLALTPHHLFYLLSRFEEMAIPVGPMKIRLENLHDSSTAANYVSFLSNSHSSRSRDGDGGSIHSVSSVRSVMSGMSALWTSFGIGASISAARTERQKAALQTDLKYLYSAFTKIPCLKLAPDRRARLIKGYEEFPFDSAVPLHVFKNVQSLEVLSIDFRQFFGWDRMADQLRSLTLRRASVEDPADILIDIILDDMDKRRRRTSKAQAQTSPTTSWPANTSPRRSYSMHHPELRKSMSMPSSPDPRTSMADLRIGSVPLSEHAIDDVVSHSRRPSLIGGDDEHDHAKYGRPRSNSPSRPTSSSRNQPGHIRGSYHKMRRSGSGSSQSSLSDSWHVRGGSSGNVLNNILPPSKWRFLRHLGLPENAMTMLPATSLFPLANTLYSLDLSSNLFAEIPDSLSTLTALRALNLAHCMIDSLQSLTRNPLPAIAALNLRGNRLSEIAGIEKLLPLERLDLRDNLLADPVEIKRLTVLPDIREIWVEGNPFVRTHRNYRVFIFNFFRSTPGYTEDPIIDGTGPTYSERKQLIDRVPMPAAVPVVKTAMPQPPVVDVAVDVCREPAMLRKERPIPKAVASETSTRRRKTPKRRIVDLATSNSDAPAPIFGTSLGELENNYRISTSQETPTMPSLPAFSNKSVTSTTTTSSTLINTPTNHHILLPEAPRADLPLETDLPPIYDKMATSNRVWVDSEWKAADWDANAELYRRRIEALRDKVGSDYLSVLSEETWDSTRPPEYVSSDRLSSSNATIRPITPSTRPPSAQPIHSGRTLG
jgi:hypothetical protein